MDFELILICVSWFVFFPILLFAPTAENRYWWRWLRGGVWVRMHGYWTRMHKDHHHWIIGSTWIHYEDHRKFVAWRQRRAAQKNARREAEQNEHELKEQHRCEAAEGHQRDCPDIFDMPGAEPTHRRR